MERSPLIGVAVVAVVGMGVATALFVMVPAEQVQPPSEAPTEPPRTASLPPSDAPSRPIASRGAAPSGAPPTSSATGERTPTSAPGIPPAPPPPLDDPPGPPERLPPPPGPLEAPWDDAQALLAEPLFDALDADGTYDDALGRVQERLDEVDALAARYRQIAERSDDPDTRDEALRLQADLYEQAAMSIPVVPPMVDGHEAWMEDHAAITGELMEKAAGLRGG